MRAMVNSESTLTGFDIALIGAAHTGKSTLIKRYAALLPQSKHTLAQGEDAFAHTISNGEDQITIWDIVGQGRYQRVREQLFQHVPVFALVYDVSSPSTFFDLMFWRDTIMGFAHRARLVVIGNKIDLPMIVPPEEAQGWASGLDMPFLTTSALTGEGVLALFEFLMGEAGRERQRRIAR